MFFAAIPQYHTICIEGIKDRSWGIIASLVIETRDTEVWIGTAAECLEPLQFSSSRGVLLLHALPTPLFELDQTLVELLAMESPTYLKFKQFSCTHPASQSV